ncbi:uncharacterized protein LOC120113688 [Hibiscus syriacus]|uniref:uncharacterized protein LOC120113688 n=1 Tax=Hibiscus syriacus TaxID=106335 RepID=UPI001924B24C|nr:uncharacterized protein LOC120113688 [Hibiscus syriacus]
MDWRKLFGSSEGHELDYHPPRVHEGVVSVHPHPEVLDTGIKEWKLSIVGQFLGVAPNFTTMQRIVGNLWKKAIGGSNVQVHLFNVPLELFSRTGLSYIASAIGNPLSMDSVTAAKSRLEYAKVCIEIGVNQVIPKFIDVQLKDGKSISVLVEVPWLPSSCRKCSLFGHSDKNCNSLKNQPPVKQLVWKKKKTHNSTQQIEPIVGGIELLQDPDPIHPSPVDDSSKATVSTVIEIKTVENSLDNHSKPATEIIIPNEEIGLEQTKSIDDPTEVISSSQPPNTKRGRGRPIKAKLSLSESQNRFDVLSAMDDSSIALEGQQIKFRSASLGVSNIVNELKQKKKDKLVKAKNAKGDGSRDVLCLLETRVKSKKSLKILSSNFANWNALTNYDFAINGRIWILWRKGLDFSFCHASSQCLTIKGLHSGSPFIITVVYGSNDDMRDFQDVLSDIDLFDHPYFGPTISWSNKQQNSFLARKLDRVLINQNWINSFHSSHVEFLAPGISDHCMALLWTRKEILFSKLKRFKNHLKGLNNSFFSDLSMRVKLKKTEFEHQQLKTLKGEADFDLEIPLQKVLNFLEETESMFFRQKTKVQWIKDGDKCTKFFHSAIAKKHKRKTIRQLIDDQGNRLENFDDISSEVIKFFTNLLGTSGPMVKSVDSDLLNNLLQSALSVDQAANLIKVISKEEIKDGFFTQGNDKAPGPDSYSPLFFKKSWPIIENDINAVVQQFFKESFLLPVFNATSIALIPEIPNPCKVKDFIPISCCSVFYKAISKILVKRLTSLIPDLTTLNQTTFVKDRSIIDNTLLAQELVRGYNIKHISPRCSLKIDLHKAFESLNWEFISVVLKAINLPSLFISWIETCYSTTQFSISFNGSLIGYFK